MTCPRPSPPTPRRSSTERREERTGDATRGKILDAAEDVFAEHGFHAASLRDLADAAGVTRSLIHHHFGSKEQLWIAVSDRLFEGYRSWQSALLHSGKFQLDGFEGSARQLFRFLEGSPNFVRLGSWANAARSVESSHRDMALQGVERLREMQKRGEMRRDIDPASALVALFNLVEHWFHARTTLESRLGDALPSDDDFLEDLVRILLRGIQPCDGDPDIRS